MNKTTRTYNIELFIAIPAKAKIQTRTIENGATLCAGEHA